MMKIIAHRGARNLWAENSLGGFQETAKLDVDAVELDLHLSRDGEIMVIHDPLLDRTTDGQGPVSDFTFEALTRIRLRDTIDETIPTLAQVLNVFQPTGLALELEMKLDARGRPYPDLIEKTAELVEAREMVDRVRLTCFVPEVLEEIRSKAGQFRRLASLDRRSAEMLGGSDRAIQRFLDLDCTIAVERTLLELEIDRCYNAIGTERLGVWVPNTPGELNYWLRQPIGQLTSDRPDIALSLRRQISGGSAASS
jgi:glycerophosphoryl diester phosphodiesterase